MDIEPGDRYDSKRIHQRMGPSNSGGGDGGGGDRYNKVCFHWQAGRCNRHPCPYLHSEPLQSLDFGAKRAHHWNLPQGLIWRNPNTGGNPAPPSKWGKDRGGANGGLPRPQVNKLCNYFIVWNCSYEEMCKFLHSWFVSDSFSLLTPLQGHQKELHYPRAQISYIRGARTRLFGFGIVRVANVLGLLVWEVKLVA